MRVDAQCERSGPCPQSRFILDDLENQLDTLLAQYSGSVQLIYLDPPFATGEQFTMKQRVGERGYGTGRVSGGKRGSTLTLDAYSDDLPVGQYYAFMSNVLRCCHKLLSTNGCLYLHVDYRTSARMRLLLDDIFGESNFLNEIIWHYKSGGRAKTHFSRKHDTIFFYRKSKAHYFNQDAVGLPRGKESRNHMRKTVDATGRVAFTIKSAGKIYTYGEDALIYPSDVWDDLSHLQQKDPERTGYDTQKPEALLERIVRASSREGDLVADLFSGSGTTAAVAMKLSRRFLAVDSSPHALHVLRKRLLSQPSTLLEAVRSDTEFCWNSDLLPPSPTVHFIDERQQGHVAVKLAGFEASKSDLEGLPHAKSLDLIDYWALGEWTDGCFYPLSQAFRSVDAGRLPLSLSTSSREHLAVHIVDVYGRQGFFTID